MKAYEALAAYYDRLMTDYPYDRMAEYIKASVKGVKGLDLACGSGRLTAALARIGYKMTGIDKSPEMLNAARNSAKGLSGYAVFAEGDLEALELPGKYDFIIATSDVLNYLKKDALRRLFDNIRAHLNTGSVFITDFSSEFKLRNIIGNNVFYEDYDDFTYIWTNKLKGNELDMDITFFIKEKDAYIRRDESQKQYIYTLEEITGLLNNAGLNVIETLDLSGFTAINALSSRILIKAGG